MCADEFSIKVRFFKMKKIAVVLSTLALMSSFSAFADIKASAGSDFPFNNKDYVGEIVAAEVMQASGNKQEVLLVTEADQKSNESNVKSLSLTLNKDDYALGLMLANSMGKKIAVTFKDGNYDASSITIITDKYWNGDNSLKLAK